ncbi:MAG: DUF3313 family protein [Planctomycetes bacterium]|nr:DUF3313 family protein [Planctomycetota bacterium]
MNNDTLYRRFLSAFCLGACVVAGACQEGATTGPATGAAASSAPVAPAYGRATPSGFLGGQSEYARMSKIEGFLRKDGYGWIAPGFAARKYSKVFLEPLEIRLTEPLNEQSSRAGVEDHLREVWRHNMEAVLGERVAAAPDEPGTLRLRGCVTKLKLPNNRRNLGLKVVGMLTVPGTGLLNSDGELTAEMAFDDGVTGERVATFMEYKKGSNAGVVRFFADSYREWGNIESTIINWAGDIKELLEHPEKIPQ